MSRDPSAPAPMYVWAAASGATAGGAALLDTAGTSWAHVLHVATVFCLAMVWRRWSVPPFGRYDWLIAPLSAVATALYAFAAGWRAATGELPWLYAVCALFWLFSCGAWSYLLDRQRRRLEAVR